MNGFEEDKQNSESVLTVCREAFPRSAGQGSPVPAKPWRVPALDICRSVLIVDASDETRYVLQTALEHRGVRTMVASQAKQGLAMAQQYHPALIVLDLEIDAGGPEQVAAPFADQSRTDHASLVLLGSVRRRQPPPQGEYITKPYHFAPLIRRIEEILSASPDSRRGDSNHPPRQDGD